ncbi:MAG: DNA polymerase III subunit gamma/tau, partial [Thermotogaceae bacterium]|nr:DNA polymerase III subunit gamma/tau [Thermotogaceae bacterium]
MESLYRKYRPKRFGELVGQEHVKRVITRAIEEGKVSHAYIFAGPRGTGKTTTARILAKALNCENRQGAEPCGKCYACRAIDEGTFMDIIELDAASNRGIDEIRKLREAVSFRPIEGKVKVYIIDEVHMLTKEAFNALLKTLEEPPEHVVFVLATTDFEKVPLTIISRCQVLEFRNLSDDLIYKRLKEVSEAEGIKVSDDALRFIARRSLGGMRDALTMLEQAWKFAGDEINLKDVEEALGLVGIDTVKRYVNAIITSNVEEVINVIEEVYRSGKDLSVLVQETIDYLLDEISAGRYEYINLSKEFLNILKDLKFFENAKLYLKTASITMCKNANFSSKSNAKKVEEKPEESSPNKGGSSKEVSEEVIVGKKEDEVQKTEEDKRFPDEVAKVIDYLKEEGDLSVYVALSMADEIH